MRSTVTVNSADAPAYFAGARRCFPWAFQTSRTSTRSPPSALGAERCTTLRDSTASTGRSSVPHSRTCSLWSTLISFRPGANDSLTLHLVCFLCAHYSCPMTISREDNSLKYVPRVFGFRIHRESPYYRGRPSPSSQSLARSQSSSSVPAVTGGGGIGLPPNLVNNGTIFRAVNPSATTISTGPEAEADGAPASPSPPGKTRAL
jgi:hypothetical protein